MVLTKDGLKKAEDIMVGDILITISIPEISEAESELPSIWSWNSETISGVQLTETEVISVIPGSKSDRIYFNEMEDVKFTYNHPVFIKRGSEYKVVQASYIEEGDYLIKLNSNNKYPSS